MGEKFFCPECGTQMSVRVECGIRIVQCPRCMYEIPLKHYSKKRHREPRKTKEERWR